MKTIKIYIGEKYTYIQKEDGELLAYFETFEFEDQKKFVIKLSQVSKEGDKFIKNYNYKKINAIVYWFKARKKETKIMFVAEKRGAFDYMIIFK
jgi:hypothetical protein